MSRRTERAGPHRAPGWLLLVVLAPAWAAPAQAPAKLLDEPAALKAALAQAIARPVDVLSVRIGEHHGEILVQERADPEIYDEYEFGPGGPIRGPDPQKVGSIDCRKQKLAFEQVDFGAGVRVLGEARAIAAANAYDAPASAELGPDIFCKGFGWRFILSGADNDDVMLELVYEPGGAFRSARRFDGNGWRRLDPKALARGAAAPAPKPPEAAPELKPGGYAQWRFERGEVLEALSELERFLGEPLRLKTVVIDDDSLSAELYKRANGKTSSTYIVRADGEISRFSDNEPMPLECRRPFAPAEAPFARLPELYRVALGALPPLQDPRVTWVRVSRGFGCGRTEVSVDVEDARAEGTVTFDANGRLREAAID